MVSFIKICITISPWVERPHCGTRMVDIILRPRSLIPADIMQTQCAISEWKTGVVPSVRFEESVFGKVYAEHVAKLEELEEKSEQNKIVIDIGR